MAAVPPGRFGASGPRIVVVHDSKVSPDEVTWPRLGVIRARGSEVEYTTVAVDWMPHGPASDLEAACLVPGTDDELLALESGYYQGRFGRLFHLQLGGTSEAPTARVLGAAQLPSDIGEAEGLACTHGAEVDEVLVILGEREISPNSHAVLHWARIDLSVLADTLDLTTRAYPGAATLPLTRVISDLFVDERSRLWAAAAEDGGEAGPYRSVVYLMGEVDGSSTAPLKLLATPLVVAQVHHLKIEGLTGPIVPGSWLSVGTEDESLGAFWFPLIAQNVQLGHR